MEHFVVLRAELLIPRNSKNVFKLNSALNSCSKIQYYFPYFGVYTERSNSFGTCIYDLYFSCVYIDTLCFLLVKEPKAN